MKYHVLIRWDGDPLFQVDTPQEADSRREAAAKRIRLLGDPLRYDDVLVIEHNTHPNHLTGAYAEIFSIRDFVQSDKRRPRYGWNA